MLNIKLESPTPHESQAGDQLHPIVIGLGLFNGSRELGAAWAHSTLPTRIVVGAGDVSARGPAEGYYSKGGRQDAGLDVVWVFHPHDNRSLSRTEEREREREYHILMCMYINFPPIYTVLPLS